MAARLITASITGGEALRKHLLTIERKLGRGASVRVGFLEGATYTGARASNPKVPLGTSKRVSGFVDFVRSQPGYTGPVAQVAFWNEFGTATSPPRPFMRSMVASKSPRWGIGLGNALRKTNYDARKSLAIMGEGIAGQLVQSIMTWRDPPNSALTVALKGFNKPLVDSGLMARSVDFQVLENES